MDRVELNIDASFFVKCVAHHRWRFLSVCSLCLVGLALGVLLMSPSYEASTVLIAGQPGLDQGQNPIKPVSESGISLAGIAESQEVLRAAVAVVGLQSLAGALAGDARSIFQKARETVINVWRGLEWLEQLDLRSVSLESFARLSAPAGPELPDKVAARDNAAIIAVGRSVKVKAEPNSDIIRISFRHKDPDVAARFTNALSQAFIERQALIFSRPGASDFFGTQSRRFTAEFERRSQELKNFMVSSDVYSIEEQRPLLLRHRNDILSALVATRSAIADKTAQKASIISQLRKLAPVARSPYVSAIVNSMSEDKYDRGSVDRVPSDLLNNESPLLLVKVYQDSMATLFKLDADLAGMEKSRDAQTADLNAITQNLDRLASNEYRYLSLKSAAQIAEQNAVMYAKRMTEEQINSESRIANFLAVKVVQKATPPATPIFPNYSLATIVALIVSLLMGTAVAVLSGLRRLRASAAHEKSRPVLQSVAA